jgi:hypothetical protein
MTAVLGLSFASVALVAADGTPGEDATGLVDVVLRSTHQFRDPQAAEDAGYGPANACVSGPEEGAMGEHYITARPFSTASSIRKSPKR